MATGKRFYYLKLKKDFLFSETVGYMMSLPNGPAYVVLYEMLCMITLNTEGHLSNQIGEIFIKYDVEKIRRDVKWFSTDTIVVGLELFMKCHLIYKDENGVYVIADYKELVGSETDWAAKKSRQRMNSKSTKALPSGDIVPSNVPIEYRDKRIEIRDKSLDSISINDDDRPDPENTRIIEEFSRLNGLSISSYELLSKCDAKTRKKISDVAKTLFAKAVGSDPTEMDEARIFSRVTDEHNKISNDKIYILTCAFYKAADAGHRGQWNYIEAILDDMHGRGITTKDQASEYFNSRRGEY